MDCERSLLMSWHTRSSVLAAYLTWVVVLVAVILCLANQTQFWVVWVAWACMTFTVLVGVDDARKAQRWDDHQSQLLSVVVDPPILRD